MIDFRQFGFQLWDIFGLLLHVFQGFIRFINRFEAKLPGFWETFVPILLDLSTFWSHCLSGVVQVSKIVGCNPYKMCGPRFTSVDLCVIMEKQPHKRKTHTAHWFIGVFCLDSYRLSAVYFTECS